MEQSLKDGAAGPARFYQMGELIVDLELRQVSTAKGRPLEVSGKSFALLEVLVKAAPETVSHADLHSSVWSDTHVSDDTVRQRVKLLRQALGAEAGEAAYVRAEHGEGYSVLARPVRVRMQRRSVPKFLIPLMLLLVIAVPIAAFLFGQRADDVAQRVYVQPFVALEPADTFLAAGFTGELVDKLVPLSGLSVTASRDPSVGDAMAFIEGSIRRTKDHLHVAVRIVDARSGDYLWVKRYDDKILGDIYAVQASIAAHVALILKSSLDDAVYAEIEAGPTGNVEAYYAYLIGKGHLVKGDFAAAKREFEKALIADPAFALAGAALKQLGN